MYYEDTIVKGYEYKNHVQKNISIINYCDKPFDVAGFTLFSDSNGGGNFRASIGSFSIGAGQTLNIPVKYNGIYLGSNLHPNFLININGNSSVYALVVSVPRQNQPPVISDITISLNNRQDYTLTLSDFESHFTDVDGDSLDAVIIEGNTSNYRLAGQPIVSGTQIPKSQIVSGNLVKLAPNTDIYVEESVVWKAVDSYGNISL